MLREKVIFILLLVCWGAPIAALLHNQISPSYESALGVPLMFLVGTVLNVLVLIAIAVMNTFIPSYRVSFVPSLVSLFIIVILFFVSEYGGLSRVSQ